MSEIKVQHELSGELHRDPLTHCVPTCHRCSIIHLFMKPCETAFMYIYSSHAALSPAKKTRCTYFGREQTLVNCCVRVHLCCSHYVHCHFANSIDTTTLHRCTYHSARRRYRELSYLFRTLSASTQHANSKSKINMEIIVKHSAHSDSVRMNEVSPVTVRQRQQSKDLYE